MKRPRPEATGQPNSSPGGNSSAKAGRRASSSTSGCDRLPSAFAKESSGIGPPCTSGQPC